VYSGKSFVNVWLGCEGMVFSYHLYSCKNASVGKLYLLPSAVWFLNLSSVSIFAMQSPMGSHLTILSLKRICSKCSSPSERESCRLVMGAWLYWSAWQWGCWCCCKWSCFMWLFDYR